MKGEQIGILLKSIDDAVTVGLRETKQVAATHDMHQVDVLKSTGVLYLALDLAVNERALQVKDMLDQVRVVEVHCVAHKHQRDWAQPLDLYLVNAVYPGDKRLFML